MHGVRIACDVGYHCAEFGLPRPLCSRLMSDVRDRQTDRHQTDRHQIDVEQHHRLIPPPIRGGAITTPTRLHTSREYLTLHSCMHEARLYALPCVYICMCHSPKHLHDSPLRPASCLLRRAIPLAPRRRTDRSVHRCKKNVPEKKIKKR